MGEQENCKAATKASKKRAYDASSAPHKTTQGVPVKHQRVALGELTNSLYLSGSTQETKTPKPKPKPSNATKSKVDVRETENPEIDVNVSPNDLQKCSYALIYQHLHCLEVEESRRPLPNYMQKVQKDVSPTMREILVDWLVEVAEEYKLVSDTLYLTVSYIDRFLSSHGLSRNELQLLGVASMLVASKYEEITPPRVEDFVCITDNSYTRGEVVYMEREVLKCLNFELGSPTARTFLRIFTRVAQEDTIFEFLACYLAELSLLDYACVRFLPSIVAASAVFLSRFTIQPAVHPWNLALQRYSGYKPGELKECILAIHDLQLSRKGPSVQAVREKYMEHKFKCVASLNPPLEIPEQYFNPVDEKH